MIEFVRGDIFLRQDAEALVNPTNCVGVMGAGLALAMKSRFPWCFADYRKACDAGTHRPGTTLIVPNPRGGWPVAIIHLPTKRHWRAPSALEDVEAGLVALADLAEHRSLRSVAVPPLGCGLGGLDWAAVRPLMERILGQGGCRFLVLEP